MKYESVLLLTYDTLGWISIQLALRNEHNENYLFHIFYGPFVGM